MKIGTIVAHYIISRILRHGFAYFKRVPIRQSYAWIWSYFDRSSRNNGNATFPCDDKRICKIDEPRKNMRNCYVLWSEHELWVVKFTYPRSLHHKAV
jgi:hypothetical protein